MKRLLVPLALGLIAVVLLLSVSRPGTTQAIVHLWDITEVYSNADGSVQFVEMFTSFGGQQFFNGQTLTATNQPGTLTNTFTFPGNSPLPTDGHHLLLATAGFGALAGGVTPDFTLPAGFLFTYWPGGTVNFANVDIFVHAAIPTDGTLSLNRNGTTGVNSPTNFAGQSGSVSLDSTVGGVAELPYADELGPLVQPTADSSTPPYAALAVGLAAVLAVVAGGWYAWRRWLR